jgi:hypothetical protein
VIEYSPDVDAALQAIQNANTLGETAFRNSRVYNLAKQITPFLSRQSW